MVSPEGVRCNNIGVVADHQDWLPDNVTPFNHEEIHSEQQKEMLILPFFIWYGLEFLFRLCQYRNWSKAYRNISFEREAYANQDNIAYLGRRKHFAWFNYINRRSYEN